MKNKSYLNRLHCKQSGRFIAVPNAVINDFVVWCRQRGVSAIKVHRYCDHLRRLRPRFRWRQKANLLDLTVDDLDDIQRFCRLRSPSLARGIAVFRLFLQSTNRLAPSEPVRVVNVWLVISGLAGPATFAVTTMVKEISAELPWSKGKHSKVLWVPVKVKIKAGQAAPWSGDTREIVEAVFDGEPRLWPEDTELSPEKMAGK